MNSIKNDWIYNNILLTDDDGRLFKAPGYYTDSGRSDYVPFYFKELPVQTPLKDPSGIFRNTISKINKAFQKIHYTNKKDIYNILTRDTVSVNFLEKSLKIS